MTPADDSEAARARAALEEAHALILELLPRLHALRADVAVKGDDTPVTAADRLVQAELARLLRAQFDQLTFVGEEDRAGWDEEASGWVAVVDPIDGTENFASGLPEWGTAIAIFRYGRHAGSMIALPDLSLRLITGDTVEPVSSRITAFSSGVDDALVRQIAETPQARIMGAAVYNLHGVITGRFARFVNPVGAYSWDLLAGLALAREHGCRVLVDDVEYDGGYLAPGVKHRVDIRR